MTYTNLEHAHQIAAAFHSGGADAVQAARHIAQINQRIGLLEGHLQCRDFSTSPETKEAILRELDEALNFIRVVWEGTTS